MSRHALPPRLRRPALWQLGKWLFRPHRLLEQGAAALGEIFTLDLWKLAPITVVVSHPDAIAEVFAAPPQQLSAAAGSEVFEPFVGRHSLFLLEGEPHFAQRRLLNAWFRGERMKAHFETMLEAAEAAVTTWPAHKPFSLHESLRDLTLEVLAKVLFGVRGAEALRSFQHTGRQLVDASSKPYWLLDMARIDLGPYSPWGRIVAMMKQLDAHILQQIEQTRRNGAQAPPQPGSERHDILALLAASVSEDGVRMTARAIRDQLVTLLVAGYETAATAMAWAFVELFRHPEIEARLRAELRRVVGRGELRSEHLPELPFLDACIRETLRLRPVIANVLRVAQEPLTIAGYELPVGADVAPCMYLAHRRPEVFPYPERFDPKRFIDRKYDRYTYFPFGGGHRQCLGRALAVYEMKVVIAHILQRTQLRSAARKPARPVRRALMLAPSGGVPVLSLQ